jgi:AcrR family transcriptional regulator
MEAFVPSPGLRERKKQKTRETIVTVALELFADRGYEQTTIADIAEAAEVSPRTIFTYFPSKEDILFWNLPEIREGLAQALRERPDGVTTVDVLREFILVRLTPGPNDELRRCIIADDETLRRNKRAHFAPLEQVVIEAIAKDLDAGPGDIRPRIVAAALIAAFDAVSEASGPHDSPSPEDALSVIEDVMDFLRGGLEALRND